MNEFKKTISNPDSQYQVVWNDPDPIEGNDYVVTQIFDICEESKTALIHYGGGSEAEVNLSELEIVPKLRKPRFFKAELKEIKGNVLDVVYPELHNNQFTMTERMGSEEAICPECNQNVWWLLPEESVAVQEGGKQYVECLSCGFNTHL